MRSLLFFFAFASFFFNVGYRLASPTKGKLDVIIFFLGLGLGALLAMYFDT